MAAGKRKENVLPLDHDPDFQVLPKHSKLSSKGKGGKGDKGDKKSTKRFEASYSEQMASLAKGYVSEKTSRKTQWAVSSFHVTFSDIEQRGVSSLKSSSFQGFLQPKRPPKLPKTFAKVETRDIAKLHFQRGYLEIGAITVILARKNYIFEHEGPRHHIIFITISKVDYTARPSACALNWMAFLMFCTHAQGMSHAGCEINSCLGTIGD